MKSLCCYGPNLKDTFPEPVSSGESSPCHSDHGKEPSRRKRVVEYDLHDLGKMFLDSSLVVDITNMEHQKASSPTILIQGITDQQDARAIVEQIKKKHKNIFFRPKIAIYKGKAGIILYFKHVDDARAAFNLLTKDPEVLPLLKNKAKVMWIYNRTKELLASKNFFAVVARNFPLNYSVELLKELIASKCKDVQVLHIEPLVYIGNAVCTMIRTASLEDAEQLAVSLNKTKIMNNIIKVGIHPDCSQRHKKGWKGPFKDYIHWPTFQPSTREKDNPTSFKTGIKDILSILQKAPTKEMNDPMSLPNLAIQKIGRASCRERV